MKKLLLVGSLMGLLTPALALAQSDFDGSWKIDFTKSVTPGGRLLMRRKRTFLHLGFWR